MSAKFEASIQDAGSTEIGIFTVTLRVCGWQRLHTAKRRLQKPKEVKEVSKR
jgi:hypothetical protein